MLFGFYQDSHLVDPNFVKLFQLSQLIIEYLMVSSQIYVILVTVSSIFGNELSGQSYAKC